jgi:hypothetical protein
MITFKYPSKDFASGWRKAFDGETDFCVAAKIGGFRKRSIVHWLDALFYRQRSRRQFGSLGAVFCGELTSCIAIVTELKRYRARYSVTDEGLLITFYRY